MVAKTSLYKELGAIICKYGKDNFTKMDFLEIYCASVNNADSYVINFILDYDYQNKPKPSVFSKSWKIYQKVIDAASKAQLAYSGFDTIAAGLEHSEIQIQIDEENSKPEPDQRKLDKLKKSER